MQATKHANEGSTLALKPNAEPEVQNRGQTFFKNVCVKHFNAFFPSNFMMVWVDVILIKVFSSTTCLF